MFVCSGESSVKAKNALKEHTEPVADIATCRFDDLTCSADVKGTVIVWAKNLKSVTKKISTELAFHSFFFFGLVGVSVQEHM